ncbi:hypothetical protein BMS17_04155 [Pseudomonas sp. C9]|nr:hypothetical protein BMS17_04155 [Pseudomonas sp. C9]
MASINPRGYAVSTQAQSPVSEFAEFGQRLIDLGMAMKRDQTTVRDLQKLAEACGIKLLNLRSVPGAEVRNG